MHAPHCTQQYLSCCCLLRPDIQRRKVRRSKSELGKCCFPGTRQANRHLSTPALTKASTAGTMSAGKGNSACAQTRSRGRVVTTPLDRRLPRNQLRQGVGSPAGKHAESIVPSFFLLFSSFFFKRAKCCTHDDRYGSGWEKNGSLEFNLTLQTCNINEVS